MMSFLIGLVLLVTSTPHIPFNSLDFQSPRVPHGSDKSLYSQLQSLKDKSLSRFITLHQAHLMEFLMELELNLEHLVAVLPHKLATLPHCDSHDKRKSTPRSRLIPMPITHLNVRGFRKPVLR